jgi:hypothetical protein
VTIPYLTDKERMVMGAILMGALRADWIAGSSLGAAAWNYNVGGVRVTNEVRCLSRWKLITPWWIALEQIEWVLTQEGYDAL